MKRKIPLYLAIGGLLIAGAMAPSCKSDEKLCDTALQDSLRVREMQLREREMSLKEREMAIMEYERKHGIMPGSAGSYSYNDGNAGSGDGRTTGGGSGTGAYAAGNASSARATGRNRMQGYSEEQRGVAYKKPVLAFPGQYPESSERALTERDLEHQTAWGKRVMLNEIYARHGYVFADPDLKRHFSKESWYKGTEKNLGKLKLTATEKQNIALIQANPGER